MIAIGPLSSRDTTIAVAVTGGALVCYGLLLSVIATPPHFKTRLAAVNAELTQADAARRAPGDGSAYPLNATCNGEPEAIEGLLRQQIAAAAASAGVDLTIAEVGSPGEPERDQRLFVHTVGFDASGPYSNVLGFANKLGQIRPALFIDTVGLDQDATSVKLKFSGRVLCSTAR